MRRFPFAAGEVTRLHRPGPAKIRALLDADDPVIVTGCMEGWPLLTDLQAMTSDARRLRHLEALWGGGETPYQLLPKEGLLPEHRVRLEPVTPSFAAFAGHVRAGWRRSSDNVAYLQAGRIDRNPAFRASIGRLADGLPLDNPRVWVGGGGQTVNLHYDRSFNVLCMVAGTKRVAMMPHRALPGLYPGPLDRGPGGTPASSVRLLALDRARFAEAPAALEALVVTVVGPGDVLVIPPNWWHHVESFGLNVMVNSWTPDLAFATHEALCGQFIGAMSALRASSATERLRLRGQFHERLAGGAPTTRAAIDEVVQQAAVACAGLPARWQEALAVDHDYFVFHAHGAPLAHLAAGAYDAMIGRLEARWRARVASGIGPEAPRPGWGR